MRNTLITAALSLASFVSAGKDAGTVQTSNFRSPVCFIENKGQVTDQNNVSRNDIDFKIAAAHGLSIFVGNGTISYQFSHANCSPAHEDARKKNEQTPADSVEFEMYRMDVTLTGANKNATIIKEGKQDYYENYFTSGTLQTDATALGYTKITYKDIYPNIDWVLSVKNRQLEYEFYIKEGGKPSDIEIGYGGTTGMVLNPDGSITANTPQGSITEHAPISYQADGRKIATRFILSENKLRYSIDNYTGALTIDPLLAWATYFGGEGMDYAYNVAVDTAGNVFLGGYTQSTANIATYGSYHSILSGHNDAFLTKFSKDGALLWATYYGWWYDDIGRNIAVDKAGDVYMLGSTSSSWGITTAGAQQTVFGGIQDAFLAKFSKNGLPLWATYFGGYMSESGLCLTLDAAENIFISGTTNSSSGVATAGVYQATNAGGGDAFIAQYDSTGSLKWATYFGGPGADAANGISTDTLGNVFIVGTTNSSSGIATTGAYQPSTAGNNEAFLAKFSNTGSLAWATYIGGPNEEFGQDVTADRKGNVFVTGFTNSTSGIATAGAYQPSFAGISDAFVSKFSNNNGTMYWSTYFGGPGDDEGMSIIKDTLGNIIIAGWTTSLTGIATPAGYKTTFGGGTYDIMLAQFNSLGNLTWGSYFGGDASDYNYGLAIDRRGGTYVSGYTVSISGITTPGAYQVHRDDNMDGYLAKFNIPTTGTVIDNPANTPIDLPQSASITCYPNPTYGQLNITSAEKGTFILHNTIGQLVLQYTITPPQTEITLPTQLPTGLYMGIFETEDNVRTNFVKVIYER